MGSRPAEVLPTRPPGVVTIAERALEPVGTEGRAVADGRRNGVKLCLVIAGRGAVIVLRGATVLDTDVRGIAVGAGRADGVLRDALDGVGNRVAVGVRCTTGLRDGVAGNVRTLGVLRDTFGVLRAAFDGVGNRVAVGVRCTTGLRDGVAGSVRTLGVLRDTLGVLRDTADGVGIRLGVWLMRGVDDDRVTVGRGDDETDGRARDETAGERETEALGLLRRAIIGRLGLRLAEEIRGAEDDGRTTRLDREGLTLGDRRMLLLDDRDGALRE